MGELKLRLPPFVIEPLSDAHDRAAFACGVAALDRYFANQATQDIRRRIAACFVAVERDTKTVVGYYTIATSSLPLTDIAAATARKLPRYPLVPAVRIGRLAVARNQKGKGLGAGLLIDGIARSFRADLMAFAIVVDAKDDAAAAFYKYHGFTAFSSAPMSLYLPLAEATKHLGLTNWTRPGPRGGHDGRRPNKKGQPAPPLLNVPETTKAPRGAFGMLPRQPVRRRREVSYPPVVPDPTSARCRYSGSCQQSSLS